MAHPVCFVDQLSKSNPNYTKYKQENNYTGGNYPVGLPRRAARLVDNVNVNVDVNVPVQYLSTRESCNKNLRRLHHEGCLQETTELC